MQAQRAARDEPVSSDRSGAARVSLQGVSRRASRSRCRAACRCSSISACASMKSGPIGSRRPGAHACVDSRLRPRTRGRCGVRHRAREGPVRRTRSSRCGPAKIESDDFNRLVLRAQLNAREVTILRAYAKYLRQVGSTFSDAYIERAVTGNPAIARMLVELFIARFDPVLGDDARGARATAGCGRSTARSTRCRISTKTASCGNFSA